MLAHSPQTQTLYAELFESTAAHELELVGSFRNGLAVEREVRKRTYLYWQLRDLEGKLRQVYLGPADDPATVALRDALALRKKARPTITDDLERLAAAYVASGGVRHQTPHFKVVDAIARAGLFRGGVVLVGSHAFVSIGAALGISWTADTIATADVDLVRDAFVTIACDVFEPIDLPGVLKDLDPTFFLVPELDLKTPSTSMRSRAVKVDLLTTAKTPRDTKPRSIGPIGLGAQPLRYMDYLIRDDLQRGLFIGPYGILVNIPHFGRFALHKLAVAERRSGGEANAKAGKDRRQAAGLILALADIQPGALRHAEDAAKRFHDKGFLRDVRASLARLPKEARSAVKI